MEVGTAVWIEGKALYGINSDDEAPLWVPGTIMAKVCLFLQYSMIIRQL